MKRFLALLLVCFLCASIFSTPAYAINSFSSTSRENIVSAPPVVPLELTELWKRSGVFFIDSYSITVTPDKGTNLKILINANATIKIEVTKKGWLWPSKTVTYQGNSGTQTFDLINNCNGNSYTIKLTNNTGVTFTAVVTQTEYI